MPITAIVFLEEEERIITAGLDYKYVILPLSAGSWMQFLLKLLMNMGILLLILLYFAEWF